MSPILQFIHDVLYSDVLWVLFMKFILCFHISIVICIHCLCTCTLLSFYTLISSLFDDLGRAHPGIGCFILLIRCLMRSYVLQGAWNFPLLITCTLVSLVFLFLCWFPICQTQFHSISLFIHYHVWEFIFVIAVIVIYYSRFVYLVHVA